MKADRNFFVDRNVFYLVIVGVSFCLIPVIVFMLIAFWPQRVLVSWLVFSLITVVVLTKLALALIRTSTIAKIRMDEEALRPGRLYAHERPVEREGRHSDDWGAQQQVKSEPYAQRPYVYAPDRRSYDVYEPDNALYRGLPALNIDSYDWEEEK